MQTIFFTSDWHLNHNREFIFNKRGYVSSEHHTEELIKVINSQATIDDIIYNLGDFCLNTTIDQFHTLISKINCQNIYLLWGNHRAPQYKNIYMPLVKQILGAGSAYDSQVYPLRYKNIVFIGHYHEVWLKKHLFVLNHYPIAVWNELKNGAIHLCGHSHGGFELSNKANTYGKILDVGWEDHKKMLTLDEVLSYMESKEIKTKKYDSHHNP